MWGKNAPRRFFGEKHWNDPLRWNRKAEAAGERHRVFCASMADVFEDREDLREERARLFGVIDATPSLDWQLLTKRPQNVMSMLPAAWAEDEWIEGGWHADDWVEGYWKQNDLPANVWIGTTVEDQQRADERIPELLAIPAAVRFLSCEPLLGPVDLEQYLATGEIDWVIVGGESGPGHRPLDLEHARVLRDQCREAGVAFFFKQVGGRTPTAGGDQLDGEVLKGFPTTR